MHKLKCGFQNYLWGISGGQPSSVSRFVLRQGDLINQNKEYAEYWMGTHPSCPSKIVTSETSISLIDYLKSNFNLDELPFLFKILSISKPLSIQVHPDQAKATYLNQTFPEKYKESKNKPEMAVILSEKFEMYYGIKSKQSFVEFVKAESWLRDILNSNLGLKVDLISSQNDYLEVLERILDLNQTEVNLIIKEILELKPQTISQYNEVNLIQTLFTEFGYDKGIIFSLAMNYLILSKGESVFIVDNMPHSYIKGELLECMINSDFVIRLGLTPKETDTDNFKLILKEKFNNLIEEAENYLNHSIIISQGVKCHKSEHIKDFSISCLTGKSCELQIKDHSILLVFKGNNVRIEEDQTSLLLEEERTYYIEPGRNLKILSKEDFEIYLASSSI